MAINKISGVSTVGGGSYDELIMDGVITCNGDIHAQSAKIDGVVTVNVWSRQRRILCSAACLR